MLSVVGQGGMSICSVRREDCSRKSKTCCTHWLHQPMTTFMTWCPCFLGLRRWCKTHVDMVRSFGGTRQISAVPAHFFRLPTPYLKLTHKRNMKSQSRLLQTTYFVSTKHARVALCAVQDGAHIPSGREVREVSPKQERCMQ